MVDVNSISKTKPTNLNLKAFSSQFHCLLSTKPEMISPVIVNGLEHTISTVIKLIILTLYSPRCGI